MYSDQKLASAVVLYTCLIDEFGLWTFVYKILHQTGGRGAHVPTYYHRPADFSLLDWIHCVERGLCADLRTDERRQMTKAPAITGGGVQARSGQRKKLEVKNKPFRELSLEPISVFTHYSQTYKRLGIMCKYSSRWLLQRPLVAGHPHAPLLPVTSLQVAGNQPEIPTSRFTVAPNQRSHVPRFLILLPHQLSPLIFQKRNDEFMGVNVYDTINTSGITLRRHSCQ